MLLLWVSLFCFVGTIVDAFATDVVVRVPLSAIVNVGDGMVSNSAVAIVFVLSRAIGIMTVILMVMAIDVVSVLLLLLLLRMELLLILLLLL